MKTQKFNKGDKVKTSSESPYQTSGIIEDFYKEGEFKYYTIKGRVFREKDLVKVGA